MRIAVVIGVIALLIGYLIFIGHSKSKPDNGSGTGADTAPNTQTE